MMYAYNMKFIGFFVLALFLVGVLTIPESSAQDAIPSWIKNNAGWWADDEGIIVIPTRKKAEMKNPINFMLYAYIMVFESSKYQEVDLLFLKLM